MKRCTTTLVTFSMAFFGFTWKCMSVHQSCADSMDAITAKDAEDKWEIKAFSSVLRELTLRVENDRILKLTKHLKHNANINYSWCK